MRSRKITQLEKNEMIFLLREGKPQIHVAAAFGVSPKTVSKYWRKHQSKNIRTIFKEHNNG